MSKLPASDARLPPGLVIRAATPADRDILVDYNCRIARETEGKELAVPTVTRGIAEVLRNPSRGRYLVATIDDAIVGQLLYTFEWSDWRDGEIWWLQSVYVAPEYRRQGVFRALFRHVSDLASATPGVVGIRLYVEQDNRAAQQTYESLGFRKPGYLVMESLRHD